MDFISAFSLSAILSVQVKKKEKDVNNMARK